MPDQDKDSVALVYSVIKETLAAQQAQKTSLETKASTLTAFAGGMFALLMGARETLIQLSRTSQTLILLSVSLLAISVVLANVVTWVRRYRADPNPQVLAQNYLESPLQQTQLQLMSNWIGAWQTNDALIERNALFLRFAYLTQAAGFVALGVALSLSVI